jgi:hypothetical protein
LTNRFRFEGDLKLGKKRDWQDVNVRVTMRPLKWEIHSIAADRNVHVKLQGGREPMDFVLRFSDLQNPAALTYQLLGSPIGDLAAEAGLNGNASSAAVGIKWDAQEDSFRIGHTAVQVYRLHTLLLERYEISAIVSRAGEILRIDLPGEFTLVNDRLTATGEGGSRKIRKGASSALERALPDHD